VTADVMLATRGPRAQARVPKLPGPRLRWTAHRDLEGASSPTAKTWNT